MTVLSSQTTNVREALLFSFFIERRCSHSFNVLSPQLKDEILCVAEIGQGAFIPTVSCVTLACVGQGYL